MGYQELECARLLAEKYKGVESIEFHADTVRLKNGEPYEYILGYVDFLGARIDLSHRPMIPRLETAFWVARAIDELKEKGGALRLADVFAGSGNVGLALLVNLREAHVDICELDPLLKPQIELNIQLNGIDPSRARVMTASALDGLEKQSTNEIPKASGSYDAIFAVPPYVPYAALPDLDPEMINFEPHLAFFAHEDGHEFHRRLINEAHHFLKDGGTLYMEADMDHMEAIQKMVEGTAWKSLTFWPDPYGATPNVVLRR